MSFEGQIFEWINQGWSNPILDEVMPFMREKRNWIPLYLIAFLYLVIRFRWRGLAVAVTLGITAGASDFITSAILKPEFARLRPCNDPEVLAILRLPHCGQGFSLPSAHAANHFALAVVALIVWPRRRTWMIPTFLLWALAISLAQVYVGVHYPGDILLGAGVGSAIACIIGLSAAKLMRKLPKI